MKEFKGKVAVITGAANGIGFGIAERCAQEGMKVVLAGINQENLNRAERKLGPIGAATLCVQTDVSKLEDIEGLAEKTLGAFGAVDLLVNNAGVSMIGSVWESTLEDWQWMMDVNLWGVIYGLRVFVPIMLDQNTECHIVNTSSVAGLLSYHPSAAYQVTKHGVVALTENLYHSLAQKDAKIGASVLCPGWVKTRIMESVRNRPTGPISRDIVDLDNPAVMDLLKDFQQAIQSGMSIQEVADITFQAIEDEQLYILTHFDWDAEVQKRTDNILQQRNPV